jgi:hypothetical protein
VGFHNADVAQVAYAQQPTPTPNTIPTVFNLKQWETRDYTLTQQAEDTIIDLQAGHTLNVSLETLPFTEGGNSPCDGGGSGGLPDDEPNYAAIFFVPQYDLKYFNYGVSTRPFGKIHTAFSFQAIHPGNTQVYLHIAETVPFPIKLDDSNEATLDQTDGALSDTHLRNRIERIA